ncbi:MAG: TetR/AcrR family transcriptional regulator [Gammaproteobacteria bacterium]|nr:TetR/AcrR family transcriptional regulator [Gammaproteobacteria bacterium]NNL49551.1 TetR/AcrR family transcriptional regulator [Woeseiaceae bacterium]
MSQETNQGSSRPTRKQQLRSVVTQHKLLDAAIAAFSENGFKGTSTRDIAERAGVHHPLITYHFKNKERLWRAAADKVFGEFRASLATSLENNDDECPKKRMASLIRAYVYYARSQPALHKVLVQEASFPNPRLDWLVDTHLKPFFDATFTMIEELQHLGVAPAGNARLLFNMIRLSSGGLLALGNELKASSGIDTESGETLDEIADMIVHVFLPGEVNSTA